MFSVRLLIMLALVPSAHLAVKADPPKEIPKEVRALEGTYTGAWTMYGIDEKGEIVKRATWTDTLKAGGAEIKGDRAFVTWSCEQVFDGAKGPLRKSEGKEGFFLKKDGTLGDNFLEMFGQTTRVTKLSESAWSYSSAAAPQELTALGFPKGASGEHVIVKMVTKEKGVETHYITRVSAVTWTDKDGKERVTQFVSMKGFHKRDK